MAKWETTHSPYGPPGKPPYVYQPFPAMLYKASRDAAGRLSFESQIAEDETQQRNLQSRGFVPGGQGEALKALEAEQAEIATLAANRAYQERTMSDAARREAAAVDDSTDGHVAVIPEAKRGRPRKVETE